MSKIKSIAITGKGGTGKTMVATMMIKELKKSFKGKLLVIDADSAMSLPYTLNIPVTKKTVSQLRADITGPGMVKIRESTCGWKALSCTQTVWTWS